VNGTSGMDRSTGGLGGVASLAFTDGDTLLFPSLALMKRAFPVESLHRRIPEAWVFVFGRSIVSFFTPLRFHLPRLGSEPFFNSLAVLSKAAISDRRALLYRATASRHSVADEQCPPS